MGKKNGYFASELADMLNIGRPYAGAAGPEAMRIRKTNGAIVNRKLAALGLIIKGKKDEGSWKLTPKGRNYGEIGTAGDQSYDIIRWEEKVIALLEDFTAPATKAELRADIAKLEANQESLFAQLERIERMLCNIVEATPGIKDFDPTYVGNVACGATAEGFEEEVDTDLAESEAEAAE